MGRKGFEPSNPAMSRLQDLSFWKQYGAYLKTIVSSDTASDRLSYGRKYNHILITNDASDLLALNHEKRIHVMKSLASLSKYLGCYDRWKSIREKHQLKWSNGDSLIAFRMIIDTKKSYSNMDTWLKNAYSTLPNEYGNILIYCAVTGLRPDECLKSIQLIQNDIDNYLNRKSMMLEHFRYPEIFIRRTKKAYLSIVNKEILNLAKNSHCVNYDSLKTILRRNDIDMRMSYCRKIFATYLRENQIETETIDLLQGRIPKSVFARHYYRPDIGSKKIRSVINSLTKKHNLHGT